MSFIAAKQPKPSDRNLKRDDTREPNVNHKKFGTLLSNIRKPNLDPSRVDKFLEAEKKRLLAEKERLEQAKSTKGKGFR